MIHPQIRLTQPPAHPPYGLLQLAALTDAYGFKVAILDNNCFRLPIDAVRQEIKGIPQPKTFTYRNLEITINPGKMGGELANAQTDWSVSLKSADALIEAVEQGVIKKDFVKRLREETEKVSLVENNWDIIGISGLSTQYKHVKEILPVCREEHPAALIVGGGGLFTAQPRDTMRWLPELDVVCIGESYITWQEILDHFEDQYWKKVKGLVYREGKNIKMSKMRPLIPEEKLDEEIPFPAYEFSPVETYLLNSRIPYSKESLHPNCRRLDVLSSYGCPWHCSFCFHLGATPHCQSMIYGKQVKGKQYRQHSPKYVVDLITHLRLEYGINFVSFIDENMTVNRKWLMDFCREFEERGLATKINWGMLAHSRTVDKQMLETARDKGCCYISYGGESANEQLLLEMHKGQTKDHMQSAIDVTHAAGINPIMTFILGLPNTTIDIVIEDCQFLIDNQIFTIPFFCQPYPATELYKNHKEKIIEQHLTELEKAFLEEPTPLRFAAVFGDDEDFNPEKIPSATQLRKQFSMIQAKIKDKALERWVLTLDDATRLSVNLTDVFNDVELAGLQYMLSTWNIDRLKKFKKILEERRDERT